MSACRLNGLVLATAVLGACHGARPIELPSTTLVPVGSASASPPGIHRELLAHADVAELPGWESRLYVIEYGPGVSAPPHSHPVEGIGFVLEGEFESAFEDGPLTRGSAGESFVDLAKSSHITFRNRSASKRLRFLMAYTIRKDVAAVASP